MKKNTLSKLGTLSVIMMCMVATMGNSDCDGPSTDYVNNASLCVTITDIEGFTANAADNKDLAIKIVWKTQGVVHPPLDLTALVVGNLACVDQYIPLGVGLAEDFEILTVKGSVVLKDGTYTGFDSAAEKVYVSNGAGGGSLEINAQMALQKDATENVAARQVNQLMGKSLVQIKSQASRTDNNVKYLSEASAGSASTSPSVAGAAR
jgi:hypothetical protein